MRAFCFVFCFVVLSGCASLQDFGNILFGKSEQKATRTPIWVYRPDLRITVDSVAFEGRAVTAISDRTAIQVDSLVNIDRVEVSSCSRHDVCQVKAGELACDPSRFAVDTTWFGNAKRKMVYWFQPNDRERRDACANLTIAVFDKNALAAWGHVVFRDSPQDNFPARFSCNAREWAFKGTSVCSTKIGYIQAIKFDEPVDNWRADDGCHMRKLSNQEFEFQPGLGWCNASFFRGLKFHEVIINAYDEVLIRDK
jgi:hypothetical protein